MRLVSVHIHFVGWGIGKVIFSNIFKYGLVVQYHGSKIKSLATLTVVYEIFEVTFTLSPFILKALCHGVKKFR